MNGEYLKSAGITDQIAAKIIPNNNIRVKTAKLLFIVGAINFITINDPNAPINIWPSPPIFQNFILNAGVTERVIINKIEVDQSKFMVFCNEKEVTPLFVDAKLLTKTFCKKVKKLPSAIIFDIKAHKIKAKIILEILIRIFFHVSRFAFLLIRINGLRSFLNNLISIFFVLRVFCH